jgi:hypothetical protein
MFGGASAFGQPSGFGATPAAAAAASPFGQSTFGQPAPAFGQAPAAVAGAGFGAYASQPAGFGAFAQQAGGGFGGLGGVAAPKPSNAAAWQPRK